MPVGTASGGSLALPDGTAEVASLDAQLRAAVCKGQLDRVRELLDAGADLERRDRYTRTPLMLAAAERRKAPVELLLERGADVHAVDSSGRTALHHATTGAAVRLLLAAGAEVNAKDEDGHTRLADAAWIGNAAVVKALLAGGADPNRKIGRWRKTPLSLAAEGGWSVRVVELLLDAGAKIDAKTGSKGTALAWAAEGGKLGAVRVLLDRGARIDARYEGETPLSLACDMGRTKVVELLLERGADPTGARPSSLNGDEVARLLREVPIRRAADDARSLLEAAAHGDVAGLTAAIEAGTPPDTKDGAGRTALELALDGGHREAATLLEAAQVRAQDLPEALAELLAAAATGDAEGVERALAAGADPDGRSASGNSAMDLACEYHHTDVVHLLLARGARPAPAEGSYAPLHWAALSDHPQAIEALLAAGAPVDARNDFGETALLIATARGCAGPARLLLLAGADPDLADRKGTTARDRASGEVARLIVETDAGRLAATERLRGTIDRWQDCSICSQLPARAEADVEAGESLPDEASRLERLEWDLWICPACGTRYRFGRDRGYYVTHWEHDAWLTRLED